MLNKFPNHHLSGSSLVFLGALFWSLNSPLVKFLTLNSIFICGLRSCLAAAALACFIRPRLLKWNLWMLFYVCSYTAVCLAVVVSLNLTSAPIAIGMQYSSIIWLFLSNLIYTRQFSLRQFLPVCVIFSGVLLFMNSGNSNSNHYGNLIALTEGFSFALMTVSAKKVGQENPLGLTAIANIFTGVLVLGLYPHTFTVLRSMHALDWLLMLLLGLVQVALGYCCYNLGVQRIPAQRASILALWEMILGPLWVALFLREYPSPPVLAGLIIILTGMLLNTRLNKAATSRTATLSQDKAACSQQ